MPVARVHKTRDFTVMSNSHFREKGMSLKAKGLLSLMLSLPDDWDYSIAGLVTLSKDGKDSVMNALNELELFGYLKRTKTVNEKGQFAGYDYDIYEKPITYKPHAGNPNTEKPNTEKPSQYNTNQQRTNESNTKQSRIETIKDIVEFLNDRAGTNFRHGTKSTQQHINARIDEGFTVDDFKLVISKKCDEWLGTDFAQYLRPATLFGSKFESYLNQPVISKNESKNGLVEINGDQYIMKDGKYYLPHGSGVAVDPYADDDLPF